MFIEIIFSLIQYIVSHTTYLKTYPHSESEFAQKDPVN